MSDQPVVHIGENSPEQVAYNLMHTILLTVEKRKWSDLDRQTVLNTYAECLQAVQMPHTRLG